MKVSEIMPKQNIRTPNLIIFRAPDNEDGKLFVEVPIVKGELQSEGRCFAIADPTDSYNDMDFDHIVLAEKIFGGSVDLRRYQVAEVDGMRTVVCSLGDQLPDIVAELIDNYKGDQ